MELLNWLNDALFMAEPASTLAPRIDHLHWSVFLTTMALYLVLTVVILYLYIRYRRRTPEQVTEVFHPPMWLEVVFVGTPFIIFMAWFTIGFRDFVWSRTPPKDTLDVYVVGKKWMWKFSYPDGPNMTDTLRVPVGRPVRLLLTSRDVIHSFFAPNMRVKQDALPGRYTETWFEATKTGTFPIFCTEYCGLNHSTMIGDLVVMEQREFDAWMDDVKRNTYAARIDMSPGMTEAQATMVQEGARLALEKGCGRCHTVDGTPHLGPTWLGLYRAQRPLLSGATVIADEAYLTRSMMDPMVEIVQGFAPMMPTFQGNLTAGEAAALVEYIKTLKKDSPAALGAR